MLQPSQAHLWVPCSLAGSVTASGEYHATPQPDASGDTDSRREGTCAAWAAELLIRLEVDHARELVGMRHANGWVVDEEMAHHAAGFVEYCRQWGGVTQAEVPVSLFGGLIRGRLDTTTDGSGGVIRVFDLKYGWRPVEAHQNWPMLCYGLAMANRYGEPHGYPIEMHIYQPRPHHPDGPARVWRIEAHEVAGWLVWLYAVATEARDNPRAKPGPHCDRCPAQVSCVANAQTGYHLYATQAERRMHGHTPGELAAELRFLEMAEDVIAGRRKALETEVLARLASGQEIPGSIREPRIGNRVFTVPPEMVELITGRSATKPKPKSPADLEKEGVPKYIVDGISTRPRTGWRLSHNPESYAEKIFGKARQ